MKTINGKDFRKMIIAGANNLQKNKQYIDDLNVFPVPDGDTGSNMSMTLLTVATEVKKCEVDNIEDVAKVASNGALRGARGNSGVITSQIFRGLYDGMKGLEEANMEQFADALEKARESAYKAVMKPKEGTMLTIIRVLAEKASELKNNELNFDEFLEEILDHGKQILQKTPDMLPALKEAGVVDSGGTGLIKIFEGMLNGLKKDEVEEIEEVSTSNASTKVFSNFNTEDILYTYCTEFLVNKEKYSKAKMEQLHDYLKNVGDSLVLVDDEEIVKVHIHTNHPGNVLEKALKIGSFISVKIENMKYQHSEIINSEESKKSEEAAKKAIGFIAVSSGDGFTEIFKNLKIDNVISGGQTMNPSTDDFLEAIKNVNAENIIIFPNNKNIIMAAEQASELCEDKNVYVIKTKNMTEAISAMINYSEENTIEEIIQDMSEAKECVKTAEITFAVRDTKAGGLTIKRDDIIGILDGNIEISDAKTINVAQKMVDLLVKNSPDIVTIYEGKDAKTEITDELVKYIETKYPKLDVEVEKGNQPLYYYIISAE